MYYVKVCLTYVTITTFYDKIGTYININQYSYLHSEISIITLCLAIVDLKSLFWTISIFTLIIRSSLDNFESGNDRFSSSDE